MRAALRHQLLNIAMHLAQALHHSSGPRQREKVFESGDEVEVMKLSQGARPEALVSAPESPVLGLVVSQKVENVVAVPKADSGGLLSGTEEVQKAISMGLLDTALLLGGNLSSLSIMTMRCCSCNVVISMRCCSCNVVISLVFGIPSGEWLLKVVVSSV